MSNLVNVVTADVMASNGVIHVLDEVILPGDVVDVAIAAGNFKTLVQLLTDLDLVDTLRNATAQTIFAPSDEAFAKLPEGTLENLTTEQATAIVLRHVVGNATVLAADVTTGPVETLGGETIDLIKTDAGGVQISYMNNLVNVVTADVMANNGVIHVLDEVILPGEPELGDVVDVAIAAGNFQTLVKLLSDLGLVDALREASAQTIFAPSDEAFAKLPEGTLESLTPEQALAIVLRHVVGGATVAAADVTTGPVETLGGEVIDLIKTDEGGVLISYMGNEIKVVTADVMASNGVIHVIEEVILPKAEEPEECEGCREGAGIIFSHLNGGSLDSIIQLFDREICQKEEHPGACVEGVNTWR